jgi:selenide,water dikinase
VGVITTALKREQADSDDVAAAVASMKRLNREAADAAQAADAHAMTDITGFGLLGHAREMAVQGSVDFCFHLGALPWLPGALQYGEAGAFPGGMGNNALHFGKWIAFAEEIDYLYRDMLFTPETSGGLLVAMGSDKVNTYIQRIPDAAVIGEVVAGNGLIRVDR